MTREEIIEELSRYFSVEELVCKHTLQRHGERAWQFLSSSYLETLLIVRRDILGVPMTCNHSQATQRGLRCNMCDIVKGASRNYLSAHVLGCGGDFTVDGMSAARARELIKERQELLPCAVRVEGGVTWLHLDTLPQWGVDAKVYEFKA
ncbi:MAG: hypothetical protein SNH13_01685 [Rikenellaceae bacterium]